MRNKEDMELLTSVDKSLTSAMEALGADLYNYLEEAEKGRKIEEEPEPPRVDMLEPFTAVGKGVKEIFGGILPEMPTLKKKVKPLYEEKDIKMCKFLCYLHYNVFKKAHGLLSW